MNTSTHTNRLIDESSPYLLQHAHNPVDWYPWGEEALARARDENKPILISIGYSACHWCHVMERESFEDEKVAAFMNEHFVNIKIDREERPDLDHVYMDAVQVMTGSGGWPLNVFLTPDTKPFYGGTYFPPRPAFNRGSWMDVLQGIVQAFHERFAEVQHQAEGLTAHLIQSNAFAGKDAVADAWMAPGQTKAIYDNLMKLADKTDGGFGNAPKFPQTFAIQYLLRYYHFYDERDALDQACLSVDKMLYGGMYDQIGGGFARYATDSKWLVPHFEKMLYDNALLVTVLSEAYQVTHHPRYARAIEETMTFIEREMTAENGGFYSALDADSEGEEGKYYVWQKHEIDQLLGEDAPVFCSYYGVTETGNWEGTNILHVPVAPQVFIHSYGGNPETVEEQLRRGREILLDARASRVRPLLDDKQLLGWNALMNIACSKAFRATGYERYRDVAVKNMSFMLESYKREDIFFHTYKHGKAKHLAYLDDLAFLVRALIELQEITGEIKWIQTAVEIATYILKHYGAEGSPLFYYTDNRQTDIIVRKKEMYDSAVPAGNSVMVGNLQYLSRVFDNGGWRERAGEMLNVAAELTVRYPASFGGWANELLLITNGGKEIVIAGEKINESLFGILHIFMPGSVFQSSSVPHDAFPLLKGKHFSNPLLIYVCENYVCNPPLTSLSSYSQQFDKHRLIK